ncbi:hypothetical protein, partial [Butyrivibrio sp. LB2008]|uniref:hypothetical protein n=1 Tax=Butyrivibrio sp. LB2008 TaxID=1408305 RepID=UPI000565A918
TSTTQNHRVEAVRCEKETKHHTESSRRSCTVRKLDQAPYRIIAEKLYGVKKPGHKRYIFGNSPSSDEQDDF